MLNFKRILILSYTVFIVSCGGGSDTAIVSPPVICNTQQVLQNGICVNQAALIPPPTINILISQPKVSIGSSVTVTWESTNSSSCVGSDAMRGIKATNGKEITFAEVAGQYTYTLICTGSGGTTKHSANLTVPHPVHKSSYENMKKNNSVMLNFPNVKDPNLYILAYAEADFFQTGSKALFTTDYNYYSFNNYYEVMGNKERHWSNFQFWTKNADGSYVAAGPSIKGCLHPRKVLVADFNNDGYADLFVACHGWDGPQPEGVSAWVAGEKSRLLINDRNGGFVMSEIDVGQNTGINAGRAYVHGASAADINNDGYVDIAIMDLMDENKYYFLINDKNGNFVKDVTRFPPLMPGETNIQYISMELIDVNGDGVSDVLMGSGGGLAGEGEPTKILYGDKEGKFGANKNIEIIPNVAGRNNVLDFTLLTGSDGGRSLFIGRTADISTDIYYGSVTVQRYDLATKKSTVPLDVISRKYGDWIGWWIPTEKDGRVGLMPYINEVSTRKSDWFIPY